MLKGLCAALAVLAATPAWAPAFADDGASLQALRAAGLSARKPAATDPYGADPLERGELRLPAGAGPFPVVVLIHGGCWEKGVGAPADMAALAEALTAKGFATWSLEYRKVGDAGGGWPGTFQDVAAGVDHLRPLARSYPLDLRRVTILGHSAGAHLALWAGSRAKLHDPVAGADPLVPATVVAIDGPGTLAPFVGVDAQVCGHPAIVPLMGGSPSQRPREYALASPAEHLPLGVRQVLVTGEFGPLMAPYARSARASGDPVALLAPAGADHFNILDPTTPQGRQVLEFVSEQIGPPTQR